mmetsp:Transcript_19096/g.36765  ORF Transcript_19096/g.36765 Transcript_19096/m.36765 type:complete len:1596 (-) Transcript_19096:179-4966(-)
MEAKTDEKASVPLEKVVVEDAKKTVDVTKEDIVIKHRKPDSKEDEKMREQRRVIVEKLLDPDSEDVDFAALEDFDDVQIALFLKSLDPTPEQIPVIMRKSLAVSAKRLDKLRTNLTFQNISYKKGDDVYLSGVSGIVKRNRMVCVLGAPDSGITTLMKTLADRPSRDAQVSGQILLDGRPIDEGFSQHLGYVAKDDLHYPTLTVRETLRMSALMRVGEFPRVYLLLIVEIMLKFFGLDGHIADTIVGDETRRGISGGQKRRVSVATELVAGHAVVLADLLTNGLDSKTSYDIVKQLQTVAHDSAEPRGNSFMISLVQPAPELFDLFDDLLLMSKGRSIYFGPVKYGGRYPVMDFLNGLGFYCPKEKSIPDFLAEISYNPVRFHVSRLPKELKAEIAFRPGSTYSVSTRSQQETKAAAETKEEHQDDGVIEERKALLVRSQSVRQARDTDVLYFDDESQARCDAETLRLALENQLARPQPHPTNRSSIGKLSVPSLNSDRDSMPRAKSANPRISSDRLDLLPDTHSAEKDVPKMPVTVEETKTEATKTLEKQSYVDFPHEDSKEDEPLHTHGLRLRRRKQPGDSVRSEPYTTKHNEREVGYAYLLESWKSSDLYYSLGHLLWTEFEPRMPWEKDGTASKRFSTSGLYQAYYCLSREWTVETRDRVTQLGKLGERIFVALLLGTVFLQLGNEQREADARTGLLFIGIMNFSFGASAGIPEIMMKKKVYIQQESSGYYRGYAFFIAQQLIFIPFQLLQIFVFCVIMYPLAGLEGGIFSDHFWFYMFTMFLCVLISYTWALFLCGISPNATLALALFPVTMILKLLLCGYMIRPDDIPVYWKWLFYIDFFTYAFRGVMLNEFLDLQLTCAGSELVPESSVEDFNTPPPDGFGGAQTCPFTSGQEYLIRFNMENFDETDRNYCLLWLTLIFVAYHLLATFAFVGIPKELGDQEEPPKFDLQEQTSTVVEHDEEGKKAVSYIEWKNLTYEVINRKNREEKITLLNDVEGFARPGDMIALMGPSGAGKSTLLDVIAGKKTSGWITGDRIVNGKPMDEYFARVAGYVEQFDTHVELATVEETVLFSAYLRLSCSEEEARKEAMNAMDAVRITHVKDRLIGNIQSGGISPELRKKLAIAVELVARPTILFLDEPTTGLDSVSAMAVIDTVTDLTKRGLAVLCTIHQPSSELFSRFGRILILQPTKTGGRVSYFGEVSNVLPYCKENNLGEITPGRNIADFALEALGATHKDGRDPADVFLESKECQSVKDELEAGVFASAGKVTVPTFEKVYAQTLGTQFKVLLDRSVRSVLRDTGNLRAQYMSVILLGLIVGSLYWDMPLDQSGAGNRVALNFLVMAFSFYTGAYKISLLVDARASTFRETTANMYKPWVQYVTNMLADMLVFVPKATVFAILIYFMTGMTLENNGIHFAGYLGMLITVFWLALANAEFFAYVSPNQQLAQAYFATIQTVFNLFCGFLIRKENIPDWWIWLYYANMIRYPLNFFNVNELQDLKFSCPNNEGAIPVQLQESYVDGTETVTCDGSQINNLNCFRFVCPITEGQDVMDLYGMTEGIPVYVGVTFALVIGIRLFNMYACGAINWVDK